MLEKKYDPTLVEQGKYEIWKQNGYFTSGDLTKNPFCIVIPPPNVTGKLHLGHAWDTALQDIIIRYKRMDGYDALWLPGMDHAGIATQAKVDQKLKKMGKNPREMDREEWLEHAWSWKSEYADNIHEQWAKLGLSLDYQKERFTLDEGLSEAVKHVFVTLYEKGLIYRGERIINWDPEAMTALSNEEVIYKEVTGAFYHLKYQIQDSQEFLTVATTRPETLFGDTAVAVNPTDTRYQHLVGKKVLLPLLNKWIPIVADEHADPEFGTGVVKITPAHDPNDFEVGNRHNLERINILNPNGTMNENAGMYKGLDRFVCREKVIEELKNQQLLLSIQEIVHSVGHSERTDVMVEPYLSKQWFVKMDHLSKQVLENQKTEQKVNFVPDRFEKILNHWMEDCHDWCISRQLWWGHRIPAWYKNDEVYVGETAPIGEGWTQDSDVLDTWFSSALWPFSTLGWPNQFDERYFPNDVLVTGYDIIFFWVCRMIFGSLEFTGKRPFRDVLIHGLVRDKEGRKMSKSLGNGVDPMDVIAKYGADSLRFFLTTSSAPGQDLRYEEEKVASTWNFINKLWNAARFCFLNLEDFKEEDQTLEHLTLADEWILTKLNETIQSVRKHMDQYEFHLVGTELYQFIWNDFCDWYLEFSKIGMNQTTKTVLQNVLTSIVQMLHPFMPYVTEEIYQMLPVHETTIMLSSYPTTSGYENIESSKHIDDLIELIQKIRKIKLENKIETGFVLTCDHSDLIQNQSILEKMLKTTLVTDVPDQFQAIEIPYSTGIVKLHYDGSIHHEEELEQLKTEKTRLEQTIERRKQLLSNAGYLGKAPKDIVENEKKCLEKEIQELEFIQKKLA